MIRLLAQQKARTVSNPELWRHVVNKAITIFNKILNLGAIIGDVLIAYMMLVICYDVIIRYFFLRPTMWAGETSEVALLFITFLGAAWLLREEGHVTVDFLFNRLNIRAQRIVEVTTSFLGVVVCALIAWYGAQVTWGDFRAGRYLYSGLLDIPNAYVLFIIPLGSFLLFVQFLRRIANIMRAQVPPSKSKS